jgi:hypothetical protein
VIVNNSIFNQNKAVGGNGGVFCFSTGSYFSLYNDTFSSNGATASGGSGGRGGSLFSEVCS